MATMKGLMSSSGPKQASTAERFVQTARSLLFGALLALCKDVQNYATITVLYLIIEWVQVLSFTLNDNPSLPWASGDHWALKPLSKFVQVFSLNGVDGFAGAVSVYDVWCSDVCSGCVWSCVRIAHGCVFSNVCCQQLCCHGLSGIVFGVLQTGLTISFAVAAIWVYGLVSLLVFAGYRQMRRLPDATLALRVTRVMVSLSSGILYLPVTGILFRSMSCQSVRASWT